MLLKLLTNDFKCSILYLSNESEVNDMELNINDFSIPFEELLTEYGVDESEVAE